MAVFIMSLSSDRPRGVLQGALPKHKLQGFCQEPVCVMSVQGAGLLRVRLLCWSVIDQHGQAQCGTAAATLLVCVWYHLCIAELHTWNLRCNSDL